MFCKRLNAPTVKNRIKIPSMKRIYSFMLPIYIYTQVRFFKVCVCFLFSNYSVSLAVSSGSMCLPFRRQTCFPHKDLQPLRYRAAK